jgi:3-keto-disaccharide hydrolase
MKSVSGALLVLLLTSNMLHADEDGFRALFNGKDLSGWKRINTDQSTWSVQDGMLICTGNPTGELRTDRMYQNFILEVEWRHMKPKGNAGIFVWADDITARGVPFHRGIEVQVLENAYGNSDNHTTHGDIFPIHGATMTPVNGRGGSRAFPTESRSNPSPEWNHYRIVCNKGEISLAVNGKVVTQGQDCNPSNGYICVESEGGVAHYRNMRIKELPDTPLDPEHVAVADRGYHCLYTGIDLSGWESSDDASANWHARNWVLAFDGKSSTAQSGLSSVENFGDMGFVIDVKFRDNSGPLLIDIRDAVIQIDPDDKLAEPVGRWNRLEGALRGGMLTAKLNGKPWAAFTELTTARSGPITLTPDGPTDFANIYARELKGPTR